jgi:hypothetical protein
MLCPSDNNSSSNSLGDIGKIVGLVIGSLLGLAVLICFIVIIYFVFCKRKPQVQVWAYSGPTSQAYEEPMPIFPYTNYPQESIQTSPTDPQKIIEEPPPAYEEINTIYNSNKK